MSGSVGIAGVFSSVICKATSVFIKVRGVDLTVVVLVASSLALLSCTMSVEKYSVGIILWTSEIEGFEESCRGIIEGLSEKGYRDGINLELVVFNAAGNRKICEESAKGLVEDGADVIVTVGTMSTVTVMEALEGESVPIVYCDVSAPSVLAKMVGRKEKPIEITGVSIRVPIIEQFEVVKQVFPEMKRLGMMYSRDVAEALANGEESVRAAKQLGWETVVTTFAGRDLGKIREEAASLAQRCEVVYLPGDSKLYSQENMEAVLDAVAKGGKPVVAVTEAAVHAGALMATHSDFCEVGHQTVQAIIKVLNGVSASSIPEEPPAIKQLSLNLRKASSLGISFERNVILQADCLID